MKRSAMPSRILFVAALAAGFAFGPAATAGEAVTMYKDPNCGCCGKWAAHMRAQGFVVNEIATRAMADVKREAGVPQALGSCHTARVGGYIVEGHVPAADVKRLLAERPDARGLTVPGMPAGSPGMEMPDGTVHPYSVELVHRDGSTSEYARHGE